MATKFVSVQERQELPANGRLIIFNKGTLKENGNTEPAPLGTLAIGVLENVKSGEGKYKNSRTYSIRAQGMSDVEKGLTGVEDGTLILIDAPGTLVTQMNNVNVGELVMIDFGGKGILGPKHDFAGSEFYKFDVKRAVDTAE